MSINNEDVEKIAHLARLAVGPEELDTYTRNLSQILDLVEQELAQDLLDGRRRDHDLEGGNAVDTENVTPMAHPHEAHQRLREDVVTEGNQRDKFTRLAPASENGLFLVPKVLD